MLLEFERIIHDWFAAEGDQELGIAESPGLNRIGPGAGELFAGFEFVQQAIGVAFVRGVVRGGTHFFEVGFGGSRAKVEGDHFEGSLEVRLECAKRRGWCFGRRRESRMEDGEWRGVGKIKITIK